MAPEQVALFQKIIFIVMAGITLLGGLAVVTLRNLFRAALALILTLFGVAGLYFMLEAGFLAAAQVLIYIGAIAILIIFTVMLTRGVMGQSGGLVNAQWGYAVITALTLFSILASQLWFFPWPAGQPAGVSPDSIAVLGKALVDPAAYMLPFEVASVLLLAALIGAIYIARDRKVEPEE